MIDLTKAPYYDSVEDEIEKGYTQILFTSGKAVQSRELSGIGSYAREHTKRIANLLYKSGTIISGCAISSIDRENGTVTMTPGSVFVDGEVFDIVFERPIGSFGEMVAVNTDLVSQTIPIKTLGDETIYVEIVSDVRDSVNDPDLLDPAEGYDNYHEAGASRLRKIARFISTAHPDYNDSRFASNPRIPIYTLVDGVVISSKTTNAENNVTESKPADSSSIDIMDVLSQRNYETLGNYLVEGFTVRSIDCDDATKVGVLVEPGVAYINGIRRESSVSKRIYIKKNLLKTLTYNEEHTIYNGTTDYMLNSSPVVAATITAPVKRTEQLNYSISTQRSTINALGYPIYKLLRVYTNGNPGTTYIEGEDFNRSGNDIIWTSTGNHPLSTYNVDYLYKPVLNESQYEIFGKGAHEVKLNLSVNSLGYAEIPAQYLNPSVISLEDANNPGVNLKKNSVWYQQGNIIKIATTGNAVLPIEITRSNNEYDTIPILDGEIESIRYFSENGETLYEKNSNVASVDYDFTYDAAYRRIVWNGNKDYYPPVGETYVANIRIPVNASSNNITSINVRFAYEVRNDLYTSRVYNSWVRFVPGAVESAGDGTNDTFSIDCTVARTRKDAICLNRNGEIVVIHGTVIGDNGIYETRESDNYLKIADIIIKPTTAKDFAIYSSDNYRLRMQDIREMFNRIQDIDYNISLTKLESYAEELASDYSLRGILAEAFNSMGSLDTSATYVYASDESQLAVPSITQSRLYPGFKRFSTLLVVDPETTTAGKKGDIYSLSAGEAEVLWVQQPYGTTSRSLTEGVYESTIFPKLEISPDSDYFVAGAANVYGNDDEYMLVPNQFITYDLPKSGGYISIPLKNGAFSANSCTIEFWAKLNWYPWIPFLSIGDVTIAYQQGSIIITSGTKKISYSVGQIEDKWVHLGFTFDQGRFKNLMLNDEVVDGESMVSGFNVSSATTITFGRNDPEDSHLSGTAYSVASLRIFNDARSSSDIATYMLADLAPDTLLLIGNFNTEIISGSIANNSALNFADNATCRATNGTVSVQDFVTGDSSGRITHIVNTLDLTMGTMPTGSTTTTTTGTYNSSWSQNSTEKDAYGHVVSNINTIYNVTTTNYAETSTWYSKDTQTKIDDYGNFVQDVSASLNLRRLQIAVYGSGLLPDTDPIEITFAGQKVNLFALKSGGKGTKSNTAGCWKANANGEFSCCFVIPEGIPIGVKEVEMSIPGGPNTKVSYWGAGMILDKTNLKVTTNTISWKENKSTRMYSTSSTNISTTCSRCTARCITCPLGQTIYVNDPDLCTPIPNDIIDYSDVQVTSLDLYVRNFNSGTQFFAGFVELSDSGYPKAGLDRWVSDVKIFSGADLREGNGKFEYGTAKYNVKFDTPIKLRGGKGYALVVGSPDREARVWVAKIGGKEPTINNVEGKTIYQTPDRGMLLSSPNSATWVAYIDEDLKYSIYIKDFFANGTLENVDASRSLLANGVPGKSSIVQYKEIIFAEASEHKIQYPNFFKYDVMYTNSEDHTGYVVFEYALRAGATYGAWTEFNPGTMVKINKDCEGLKIRAKLLSFSKYSSPTVDGVAALTLGEYNLPSYYVSKTVTSGRYNRVNAYIDKFFDEGKYDVELKYSPDAGYTWRDLDLVKVNPISIDADEYLTQQYQHEYSGGLTLGAPKIENVTPERVGASYDIGRLVLNKQYDIAYCLKDMYGREGPLSETREFTIQREGSSNELLLPKITIRFDPNATGYAVYIRNKTDDGPNSPMKLWYDSTITSNLKTAMNATDNTLQIGAEGRFFPKSGVLLIDSEYMQYTGKTKVDDSTYQLTNVQRHYTHMGMTSEPATHAPGVIVYLADQCAINRGNITGTTPELWRFGNYNMFQDVDTKEYYFTFTEVVNDKGIDYLDSDTPLYDATYPASFESTRTAFKVRIKRLDDRNSVDKDDVIPSAGRVILNTHFEAY